MEAMGSRVSSCSADVPWLCVAGYSLVHRGLWGISREACWGHGTDLACACRGPQGQGACSGKHGALRTTAASPEFTCRFCLLPEWRALAAAAEPSGMSVCLLGVAGPLRRCM